VSIEFTKMHGLGNDFVVVDGVTQRVDLGPERIRALGDRHTGIGFDQLLVVETPDNPEADFRYRIFNVDGSEAEQCGNGARCFARFVRDRQLTRKRTMVLETSTGTISCTVHGDRVEVDMGEPVFRPDAIPFDPRHAEPLDPPAETPARRWALDLGPERGGERVELVPVSMGNPHAVVFVDDVAAADVAGTGAAVQAHAAFPESVNVGFCQIVDAGFARLRVYERAVGETRACGSGACAAVAAAVALSRAGPRVKVSLPGGKLRIEWQGPGHGTRMAGPAETSFEGRLEP
jgi:diaminopimelate epimerase